MTNNEEQRIVVVSNRLPFFLKDNNGSTKWVKSAGGLITALEPFLLQSNGIWLGWNGKYSKDTTFQQIELLNSQSLFHDENQQSETKGNYRIGCIPINADEVQEYYDKMSNCTLWSLFHYFFEKCALDYSAWKAYEKINERFAAYIDQVAKKDDLIWIHDYQLFLVPFYLRKMRPEQKIHFFLHIPFPHYDIFSILPWQHRIIESLLCCQTVGFHHKQYLKNFEEAVAHYRQKKLNSEAAPVSSAFYANPISIDYELIDRTSQLDHVVKRIYEIRAMANAPKMIIGVDRIDYSKGIKERLLALEMLIKKYPEISKQFYYYQLVVPSREASEPYQILKREIDEIVGRINGIYSVDNWTPVHYHYATVKFEELVALYSAADIALVTPLRDGMNLVCKEYVAAHSDNDGVLILSKFAGAAAELKDSLIVNPYAIKEIAEAIHHAMHMPKDERVKRMTAIRKGVKSHDIHAWLKKTFEYFEDEKKVHPFSVNPG